MRKANKLRGLVSGVLAAAMVMSMSGMTAWAETGVIVPSENKITITKEITASNELALLPDKTFSFKIEPDSSINSVDTTNTTINIYEGVENAVSTPVNITFANDGAVTQTGDITVTPGAFENPGIYRYKVTEDDPGYDGMTKDSTEYYLDLYIVDENGSKKLQNAVVSKYNAETQALEKSDLKFTNSYETHNLTVTKIITGNQAVTSTGFHITITVHSSVPGKIFKASNDTNLTVDESDNSISSATFELSNEQSVVIYGLSAEDKFTVVETDANTDGYTTKYQLDQDEESENAIQAVAEGNKDRAVVVTNTKNVTTPTGIILTFAPYALMVALAGVIAVMFLRKKREEEY